ncbi:hypothetical protein [Pseudoalteromonas piratica]|uniref:Uncharacterized protein n=1 Tax=Pseudoalteromonas piratica TaxID=1348114 RepID=A0A0A7EJ67_9GAMM|nr:hypothetical protein [Pseudoalteromonas piratica]AIY66583.1 hypothetical protein OM33_15680 [Pseudoalteromonas piratica]
MNPEKFISGVRGDCINELVSDYGKEFSKIDIEKCSDKSIKPLLEYWQQADDETRKVLSEFIRLGAQNGVSSLLSIISSGGHFNGEFKEFELSSISGNSKTEFSEDLLDIFWEQEEISGNVNVKT